MHLGLHKNRDDLARRQRERAVPEYIQQAADLSRVAGDADPGRVVIREDVIQNLLAARQLVVRGLPLGAAPELIALREALLEGEVGNGRMDVRLA